jgi:hypothetical protein
VGGCIDDAVGERDGEDESKVIESNRFVTGGGRQGGFFAVWVGD